MKRSKISIPFRIRMEPNEHQFRIKLPRAKIEEGFAFHFDHLTIITELYSKQAQLQEYDSTLENAVEYTYPFVLDISFGADYYKAGSNKWSQTPSVDKTTKLTLESINTYFDINKPDGSQTPPLIFDWQLMSTPDSGFEINEFHKIGADSLYGRPYDADLDNNWLPASARLPGLNNLQFPNLEGVDPRITESIQLRMHIGPNVKVGFSNDELLKLWGFSETQYSAKGAKSDQNTIVNTHRFRYLTVTAPTFPQKMVAKATNKITVYPASVAVTRSPESFLKTIRGHQSKFDKLAKDYSKPLKAMANLYNTNLELDYDTGAKMFKFRYPAANVTIEVHTYSTIVEQLGYGKNVVRITPAMTPASVTFEKDLQDLEKNARSIVYDVGLATVTLDDSTNLQTIQFQNQVMATLEPEADGTLRMRCQGANSEDEEVYVSSLSLPELVFSVSRFSEDNKPVPLGLPIGIYMQGKLIGKSIKAKRKYESSDSWEPPLKVKR